MVGFAAVVAVGIAGCGSGAGSAGGGQSGGGTAGSATLVVPPATVVAEPFLAQAEGIFAKNGVSVKIINAQGGGDAVKLWVGGQADFAATGTNLPMSLAEQDVQARDIIGLYDKSAFTILAQPSLHLAAGDIKSLKGKRVGVDSLGTPGDQIMRIVLKSAGVNPSDVTFVATNSGSPQVAAFEAGAVDAAITSDPATSVLLAGNKATNLLDLRKGEGPAATQLPQASLAATSSYLSSHQATAVAVVKSMCEAMKFGRDNPDKAVADLSKVFPGEDPNALKMSVTATAPGWQATLTPDGIKAVNALFKASGSVKKDYTYDQVVDTSFQQYWQGC
jgi:NitT/TauT family transport system substrate-binding protein